MVPLSAGLRALVALAAVALDMCLVSSAVGATSMCASGLIPWSACEMTWLTWWLGDVGGVLIVAPVPLAWSRRSQVRWHWTAQAEATVLFVLLAAVGELLFGGLLVPGAVRSPLGLGEPEIVVAVMPRDASL